MNDETLRQDISYLRKVAESGRHGPILGGAFLAGAGVVFGLAAILDWASSAGYVPLPQGAQTWLWIGAFVVFALYWFLMFQRLRATPKGAGNASTAAFGTVWGACGAGVMVAWVSTLIVAGVTHTQIVLTAYIPVIFAFYGTAWFASAALSRRGWMALAGGASYLFALALAYLTQNPLQELVMGGALIVLLTLPGLKLVADEARA
ncbi:hypothetical protein FHS83_003776 [Rhizomicrobium palustre]|uniref:Uncharacterized protein n=1 Tax=Rhizomicrobium palustre TaxID=189966 RepID=A0A846N3A6_9PROT|nr:hypothetical protein [Rhizomicrobium palustre]NIK90458.1 hypothetical protein [Rhizomicrobium palustre]